MEEVEEGREEEDWMMFGDLSTPPQRERSPVRPVAAAATMNSATLPPTRGSDEERNMYSAVNALIGTAANIVGDECAKEIALSALSITYKHLCTRAQTNLIPPRFPDEVFTALFPRRANMRAKQRLSELCCEVVPRPLQPLTVAEKREAVSREALRAELAALESRITCKQTAGCANRTDVALLDCGHSSCSACRGVACGVCAATITCTAKLLDFIN